MTTSLTNNGASGITKIFGSKWNFKQNSAKKTLNCFSREINYPSRKKLRFWLQIYMFNGPHSSFHKFICRNVILIWNANVFKPALLFLFFFFCWGESKERSVIYTIIYADLYNAYMKTYGRNFKYVVLRAKIFPLFYLDICFLTLRSSMCPLMDFFCFIMHQTFSVGDRFALPTGHFNTRTLSRPLQPAEQTKWSLCITIFSLWDGIFEMYSNVKNTSDHNSQSKMSSKITVDTRPLFNPAWSLPSLHCCQKHWIKTVWLTFTQWH